MADENKKITDFDVHGAWADDDTVEIVDDPSGSPDNEKATVSSLVTGYVAAKMVREVAHASLAAASAAGLLTLITDTLALARDNGAAQKYYGPLWPLTPLDQSGWSWLNQGSSTVSQSKGIVRLSLTDATSETLRARVTTAPAAPYIITAAFIPDMRGGGGTHDTFALFWRLASTDDYQALLIKNDGDIEQAKYVSTTSVAGGAQDANIPLLQRPGLIWLQIEDNNTNRISRYSLDGVNFREVASVGRTSHFGSAPDQIGFGGISNQSPGAALSIISWVQA